MILMGLPRFCSVLSWFAEDHLHNIFAVLRARIASCVPLTTASSKQWPRECSPIFSYWLIETQRKNDLFTTTL